MLSEVGEQKGYLCACPLTGRRRSQYTITVPPDRPHPTTSRGIQRRCGGGAAQPARTLQRNLSRLFVGPRHDSDRGRGRHCPPHRHQAGHAGRLDYRRAAVPSPAAWPRPCGVAVTSVPLSGTATLTGCHSLRFLSLAPARPIATLLGLALRIVPQAQQAVCWRTLQVPWHSSARSARALPPARHRSIWTWGLSRRNCQSSMRCT